MQIKSVKIICYSYFKIDCTPEFTLDWRNFPTLQPAIFHENKCNFPLLRPGPGLASPSLASANVASISGNSFDSGQPAMKVLSRMVKG